MTSAHCRRAFDLDASPENEPVHAHRAPGTTVAREERDVDLIRALPLPDVRHHDQAAHRASRQSRLSALEGGADDYLVKPFDPEDLRLRIANALESRRRLADRLKAVGKAIPFASIEFPRAGNGHDFAEEIEAVLRERMGDEDFDVDEMAEAMAMTRATLYRKSDEVLGVSPKELLWTFRLRQAAHWLHATNGTVSEVAYACGFKTVPHFTRRSKEHFGTTPAAYRRHDA